MGACALWMRATCHSERPSSSIAWCAAFATVFYMRFSVPLLCSNCDTLNDDIFIVCMAAGRCLSLNCIHIGECEWESVLVHANTHTNRVCIDIAFIRLMANFRNQSSAFIHTRIRTPNEQMNRHTPHTFNNNVCKLHSMKTITNSLYEPCGLRTKSLIKQKPNRMKANRQIKTG